MLLSIGELARQTGLSVKAVRFYSDRGIVPPSGRSPAGYRRYGPDAVARLELVRTLRNLGLDLPTVRRVVDREVSLAEAATVHAAAAEAQIRALLLRRAVLTAIARRDGAPADLRRLAALTEQGRRCLVDDFLDAVFDDVGAEPAFVGIRRSMTPELPENPAAEQVEAWVELVELVQDPNFQESLRRLVGDHAAEHPPGAPRRDLAATVRDHAAPALAAGIDPASPAAGAVVAAVASRYASVVARPDDLALRRRLRKRLAVVNDPRRERYARLLATINGWPSGESLTPVLNWFTSALDECVA
jgi:DNA-binding transcriptional MerR regulator